MRTCTICKLQKPTTRFKKYTTKTGELRFVKNCHDCASLERKLARKAEKQANPKCIHCKVDLSTDVNWNKSMKKECCYVCKGCHKSYASQLPEKNRDSKLRKAFGIDLEEFNNMLEAQNGLCAICFTNTPKGNGTFHVDHDHATGKIRGLLCHHCNTALGSFKDDTNIMKKAIEYLKNGGVVK